MLRSASTEIQSKVGFELQDEAAFALARGGIAGPVGELGVGVECR